MFAVSAMGLADIHPSPVFNYPAPLLYTLLALVAAFKATALTQIWCICKPAKALRITAAVLLSVYGLICFVNFASDNFYGFGLTHKLITLITQTNARETAEFLPVLGHNILSALASWQLWVFAGILAMASFSARFIKPKAFGIAVGLLSISGAAVSCYMMATMAQGRTSLFMTLRIPRHIAATIEEQRETSRLLAMRRPLPDADKVTCTRSTPTIIMVVGESAARSHHSLYGYPLPTTPHLDARADSLWVFSDAIGCSPQTAGNMERILSFKPDSSATEGDWARYPLLVDLFNAAGYTTSWLSNQERVGIFSNASFAMVSQADKLVYCGSESSFDAVLLRYDEAVLPELVKALSDTAAYRFIGMHLLGSHFNYQYRYPPQRAQFSKEDVIAHTAPRPWLNKSNAKIVAEYDNSIAYTDSILGKIIEATSLRPEPAVMIYFSDHGENVFDTRDFCGRDDRFVEVPFIIYANSAFREANPDLTERIKDARDLPISTSNIVHSLITLAGISYPAYDPTLDFLSPQFRPRPRYVDGEVWQYEHVGKQ